jgi:hypothetical protein
MTFAAQSQGTYSQTFAAIRGLLPLAATVALLATAALLAGFSDQRPPDASARPARSLAEAASAAPVASVATADPGPSTYLLYLTETPEAAARAQAEASAVIDGYSRLGAIPPHSFGVLLLQDEALRASAGWLIAEAQRELLSVGTTLQVIDRR